MTSNSKNGMFKSECEPMGGQESMSEFESVSQQVDERVYRSSGEQVLESK